MMAVAFYGCRDITVVGGDVDFTRAAFARPFGYSHDHGPASNIGERLSGKPARGESRRDNGGEGHVKDFRRSSPFTRSLLPRGAASSPPPRASPEYRRGSEMPGGRLCR